MLARASAVARAQRPLHAAAPPRRLLPTLSTGQVGIG
jgi:hypothetical protein